MLITTKKAVKNTSIKNAGMSIPNSLSANKIFSNDMDIDSLKGPKCVDGSVLLEMFDNQHPLIHTWLLLSSISICFLSALFFIIPQ